MTTDHTVRAFDQELSFLQDTIVEMGGIVEAQLARAVDALVKRDHDEAERVIAADAQLDALERQVNERAIRLLALRQPMAADLRAIIAAFKISGALERMGDYAKNIAKRTAAVAPAPPLDAIHTIARMGRLVQEIIKTVLDAYVTEDAGRAADARLRDQEVDQLHNSLFREIVTYMMEDPRNITACAHLLFIAKNVERIGDHATNIAENVLFLVEGKTPEGERPKGDTTASAAVSDKE